MTHSRQPAHPITHEDVIDACGPVFTSRGDVYQRSGMVRSLEWLAQFQILEATVAGSYRNSYGVSVTLDIGPEGTDIVGECDCPVGFECKHVAAVLLDWIARGYPGWQKTIASRVSSDLDLWLESQLHTGIKTAESADDQFLIYHLKLTNYVHTLNVDYETYKVRWLKKGGIGKPARFNLRDSYAYSAPRFVTEEDLRILRLTQSQPYSMKTQIIHHEGALALRLLLDKGRVFVGEVTDPHFLEEGPRREISMAWEEIDEGSRLNIQLAGAGEGAMILPVTPAWYLDIERNELGLVDHPLGGRELMALKHLPTVVDDDLARLTDYLLLRYPAESVPIPTSVTVNYFTGKARPVLKLGDRKTIYGQTTHALTLLVEYGPVRLAPGYIDPRYQVVVPIGKGRLAIERDLESEFNWCARLFDMGLKPANDLMQNEEGLVISLAGPTRDAEVHFLRNFLAETIPQLETEGWIVEFEDNFGFSIEPLQSFTGRLEESENGWFSVALDIDIDGRKVPLLPILLQSLSQRESGPLLIEVSRGQWLEAPEALLRPVLDTLVELYDRPTLDDHGALALGRQDAGRILDLDSNDLQWRRGPTEERVRELGKKLRDFSGIKEVTPPSNLKGIMRHYQADGLNWLQFLREYEFGGILADDMGLGKTLQALSHILKEKQLGRLDKPTLVVAPTSLLGNWRREAERFAPDLKVMILHGLNRRHLFEQINEHDLVITSYALVARDQVQHNKLDYYYLILDEAQHIKNPTSKTGRALRMLKANHRLCITGTPMENHLGEIWSLFDFLMPGFLGDQQQFNRLYRNPIEKKNNQERAKALSHRVSPFLLRRTKENVAKELPAKSEILLTIDLMDDQRRLYESIRIAMERKVGQLLQQKGLRRSHIEILDALLKLRQACCDPRLVKLNSARSVKHSAKLEMLREMLPELIAEGRYILLFSQFTSMLALIEIELDAMKIGYVKLTGQSRNRDAIVDTFQSGEVPVFLVSLKAGGVGLNLTRADTVILYDPWWNPAVENQAIDRAHRIGQDKPVMVYRLITEGTVEEKVMALQERKQALADGVYGDDESNIVQKMQPEDLLELFKPLH